MHRHWFDFQTRVGGQGRDGVGGCNPLATSLGFGCVFDDRSNAGLISTKKNNSWAFLDASNKEPELEHPPAPNLYTVPRNPRGNEL